MFRARPEGPGCDRVKGIVDQKEVAQFEIPYRAGKMIREKEE